MKILLIAANSRAQGSPSLGIGYLSSYLLKYATINNLNIKIMNYIPSDLDEVKEFLPDLVGISALTTQYTQSIRISKDIKKLLNIPIILGGHHISIAPYSFDSVFDAAVIGEGEQTFLELVEHYNKKKSVEGFYQIDGLLFKQEGKLIKTNERKLIEPIDKIPPPSRELFNMEFMLMNKNVFGKSIGRGTHLFTSRGCPFHCVFCSASSFWKKIRYHTPEYVLNEIELLIDTYDVNLIHIYDDLFSANKKRLEIIADMISEKKINEKVQFGMFCRADIFDEEICKLLKKMNTVFIEFGIESGNQEILNFLKGGRVKLEQIEKAVSLCKKHNILVSGTFIIGSPNETEEQMLQTLEFIKHLKLDKFSFFTLCPFPGTPLWEITYDKSILSEDINWNSLAIRKTEKLTEKDLIKNHGQVFVNTKVSPKRFIEILEMFQKERDKLYNFKWESIIPEKEDKR